VVYIACEELNFLWREQDVEKVERLWREGYDIRAIAKIVKRNVDEVAILIMDRARCGALKRRPTGVFGKTGDENANQSTEQLLRRMRVGKGRSSVEVGFLSVPSVPTAEPDHRAK